MIKKIAITGPESTGKSWLTQKLAGHFRTDFVPEYARTYIEELDRDYNLQDIEEIAKGQLEQERIVAKSANTLLFCDTELIVTKIWCLHKYGYCPEYILHKIKANPYSLLLLSDIDLPWEYDPQREHPNLRKYFFDWFEKELKQYNFNYRIVSGEGNQRLENAVSIVNDFLKSNNLTSEV